MEFQDILEQWILSINLDHEITSVYSSSDAIKRLEKKVEKITNQFAALSYGTPEYDDATKTLKAAQQELKKQYALWEKLIT